MKTSHRALAGAALALTLGASTLGSTMLVAHADKAPDDGPPLKRGVRVISYNTKADDEAGGRTLSQKARVGALNEMIRRNKAGLVGLQEFGKGAKKNGVGKISGYAISAPGNQALVYRTKDFRLKNTTLMPQVAGELGPKCSTKPDGGATKRKGWVTLYHVVDRSAAKHQYVVANVHLTPGKNCGARRVKEAGKIVERIGAYLSTRKSAALVVLGDFNTGKDSRTADVVTAFSSIAVTGGSTRTMAQAMTGVSTLNKYWDNSTKNDTSGTLDRIFADTGNVNIGAKGMDTKALITSQAPPMTASDHYLLWANLWWPKK